jgi:hypothetical protein
MDKIGEEIKAIFQKKTASFREQGLIKFISYVISA